VGYREIREKLREWWERNENLAGTQKKGLRAASSIKAILIWKKIKAFLVKNNHKPVT
jgi:hypothetical protein